MLTIGIKIPILKISKKELTNINKVRKKILSIPVSLIISNNFFKPKNIQLFFLIDLQYLKELITELTLHDYKILILSNKN